MRILVTGAAGFIGFHLAARLLARGDEVVDMDGHRLDKILVMPKAVPPTVA